MICQTTLPFYPWMDPKLARLPGIVPVEMSDWLQVDEVFAAQMALVEELLTERRAEVAVLDADEAAARELLDLIVIQCAAREDYRVSSTAVTRPDGITVGLDQDHPLVVVRSLVQEDLLVHERRGDVHHLTGGVLAFPASWTLTEKAGRSLAHVHAPVADYDASLERRVERLFQAIRPGQVLMRANALCYGVPNLFHPRTEANRREDHRPHFVRVERQSLVRLPVSQAVVFSIHTYVVPVANVPEAAMREFPKAHIA